MRAKIEQITPRKAAEYLSRNNNNRPLRERRVETMAADMTAGRWRLTHQGIAFNCDGSLRDGQHRLAAITRSGVTVAMWVFEGLGDDAMTFIDTHQSRTVGDVLHFRGHSIPHGGVAAVRRMVMPFESNLDNLSREDMLEACITHQDAVMFVLGASGKNTALSRHSCVVAAVAKAYYHADRDRLMHFIACLNSGVVTDPKDQAAAALARFFVCSPHVRSGGSVQRGTIFRKAITAIEAFLSGRPISKIYEASTDPFPLPQ